MNASGIPIWDSVLRTPAWSKSTASAILETSDGGLLVVAATYALSADHLIWAVRLDGGGSVQWQRTFGTDLSGLARAVEASDGSLYLAARNWLMKLDPAGNVAWRGLITGIRGVDIAATLATPTGGCLIAGGTWGNYGWDGPVLISVDASGDIEWQRIGAGAESPQASFRSIAAIPGSGYVLAGTRRGGFIAGFRQFAVRVASDPTQVGSCYLADAAAFVPSAAATSWRSTSAAPVPGALVVTEAPFSATSPIVGYEEICAPTNPPLPLEVSPPGSPAPLIFTDHSTLWWESGAVSGSLRFNVYRSDVRGLRYGGAVSCLLREWPFNAAADPERPWPGQAWAYLVNGVNVAGEGPLGRTSLGAPRMNDLPCP